MDLRYFLVAINLPLNTEPSNYTISEYLYRFSQSLHNSGSKHSKSDREDSIWYANIFKVDTLYHPLQFDTHSIHLLSHYNFAKHSVLNCTSKSAACEM